MMKSAIKGLLVALALSSAGFAGAAHADEGRRWERVDDGGERGGSVRPGMSRQRDSWRASVASVIQQGGPNTASIDQIGSGNSAIIRQIGRGNAAAVQQNGDNNTACVIQIGRSLDTAVVQNGNESTGILQTPRGSREIPVSACSSRTFRPNVRPGMDRR
jgi:Curlin associated repeat